MREWVWDVLGGREVEASIRSQLLIVLFFGSILSIGYYTNETWLPAVPVGILVVPLFVLAVTIVDDRFGHLAPQLSDGVQAVLVIGSVTLFGYFDVPERVAGALGVSDPALDGFIFGLAGGIMLLVAIRIGLTVKQSRLTPGQG